MTAPEPGQAAAVRWRKKPVVVHAVQLTPENIVDVMRWVAPAVKVGQAVDVTIDIDTGLTVKTLEGDMRASFGDWVIKGVKGEFYPCKPDIFEATYEPADAAQERPAPEAAQGAVHALRRLADPLPFGDQDKPLPPEAELRRDYAQAALDQAAEDAAQEQPAPGGPAGCECGHAQTGHAFSDDVCAVPECPCSGYRRTPQPGLRTAWRLLDDARATLAVTAAENADLRQQCDKLRGLLDDFTHALIDLDDGARLVAIDRLAAAAHGVRAKAGLPAVDKFSNPEGQ